jgi:surface-adhesin protein E
MKRLFLLALMLLSGGPAYGEWVRIATDDQGMTAYVDLDTIQREGDRVEMWALVDIETAKGDSFLSRKKQVEYDCAAERHRLLAGSWYSGHMGKGIVDAIDSRESKWNRVEPDSIPQILWKVACGKK